MYWTTFYVIDETDVIAWMPIEWVKYRIEFDCIDELVNWIDHLQYRGGKKIINTIENISNEREEGEIVNAVL